MVQVIKVNGLRALVMVMEFTKQNKVKNIVANGKMMSVTAKVSGLKPKEQSFLETLEMICAMDYAQYKIKEVEIHIW